MHLVKRLILPALLLFAACSTDDAAIWQPAGPEKNDGIHVMLACARPADQQPHTTEEGTLLLSGASDNEGWSEEQTMAVWATADNGATYPLNGQTFNLLRYGADFQTAVYTSTMSSIMPAGTYTYMAVSPAPQSVSGTQVTFELPAVQSGQYDGTCDLLVADPMTAGALPYFVSCPALAKNDPTHKLHFRHKCHALRIEVPEGRNLWGEEVSRLQIDFPTAVVGDVTLDFANPSATTTLANGSNRITVELPKPLTTGEGNYIWVFVHPAQVNGEIAFTSFSKEGYRSQTLSVAIDKSLQAGHATPITLTVPEELPVNYLDFSIAQNLLGEEHTSFTVHAPEGVIFRNGQNTWTISKDDPEQSIGFYPSLYGDLMKNNQQLTVTYESKHTTGLSYVATTGYNGADRTAVWLTVPYLFEEDFSGISGFSNNDNMANDAFGMSNPLPGADYSGNGLIGWSGAASGGQANTAVRICGRYDNNLFSTSRRHGRLDSCPLVHIKSGLSANPKVRITFSYSAGRSRSEISPIAACGYTTTAGVISGAVNNDNWEISVCQTLSLSSYNGSFTSIGQSTSYDIVNCTPAHRLSWEVNSTGTKRAANANTWLYIDNIRVSIVP